MNTLTIQSRDESYREVIEGFFQRQFPDVVVAPAETLLERVHEAIMGSGKTRLGPRPTLESQVEMRKVMDYWIKSSQPIPFMVPWGSEKPDGSSVDIAEVGAIKTLLCLNNRLTRVYPPGATFRIRLEDVSAQHLFYLRAEQAEAEAKRYTEDFTTLLKLLNVDNFIIAAPESALTTSAEFNAVADSYIQPFIDYLFPYQGDASQLQLLGWNGNIPEETIRFYMDQYKKLYPGRPVEFYQTTMARYFAEVLARKKLGLRGDLPQWKGQYLDLSFVKPAPGTDSHFSRRVLYRTFPENITSNHLPPWRAKGYFLVQEDGRAKPQLTTFNSAQVYHKSTTLFSNGETSLELQTDFILG